MNWMISLVCLLLVTTLTGSLAQILWYLAKCVLERIGYPEWCLKGIWFVTLCYLIPVAFVGMVLTTGRYPLWGGVLFLPTPLLVELFRKIFFLWLAGAAVTGIFLLKNILIYRSIRRTAVTCGKWEKEIFAEACKKLGISPEKLSLYKSDCVVSPSYGGYFRPMVVFPVGAFTQEECMISCLHELTHYKQKAPWLLLAVGVVKATQWFNPLVWHLKMLADKWMEFDCDERASQKADSVKSYFSIINGMLKIEPDATMTYLARNECELIERIRHMKKIRKVTKKPLVILPVLAMFLAGVYSLTVAAASNGVGALYQQCYELTVEEEMEPVVYEVMVGEETEPVVSEMEAIEYTGHEVESHIIVREEEIFQKPEAAQTFGWTIPGGYMKQTAGFFVKAGQKISVSAFLTPENQQVKIGIVDAVGEKNYVLTDRIMTYSFEIDNSGIYYIYIENDNPKTIEVDGMYRIR